MTTVRKNSGNLFFVLLGVLAALGLGVGIIRLLYGLGPTTALSDAYPWGLWIVYDVFFVPFSAGAFMILAVAHISNRHEYHALARPVVLAGFLGEIMVVAVLVMDLGRWHQFYNVLFPWYWNINSFMFQVSICLTVYMGIMVLELAPIVLEKLNWIKPLRLIRALTVLVASIGIVLSVLHQASLGSLFLLMPYKLHPLWWTPILPLLFLASSAFAGLSMAILVVTTSFRAFHRRLDRRLLSGLAQIAAILLGVYLVMKVGDLALAGELDLMFTEGWLSVLFWVEMIIGVFVPLVLFGVRRFRSSAWGLMGGSISLLVGLFLNRINVALLAESAPAGASYVPSWMEIVISLAAVAGGILIFALAARFLPILPEEGDGTKETSGRGWSWKGAFVAVGAFLALTVAVVLILQPGAKAATTTGQESEQSVVGCVDCHLDTETLRAAGADPERLPELVVEPQPENTPHGAILCVTCHHGNEVAGDSQPEHVERIHANVIADPSTSDTGMCLACHRDLPKEFPEDRLRTPHDELSHGEAVGVVCSDCHGGVGHGFDPVSGDAFCPMGVCMDCHQERNLDSELTDCDACHIGAHETVPAMNCDDCHQSTDVWGDMETESHPIELVGAHAETQCLECHQGFGEQRGLECADCHEAPGESHFGPTCEDCHTPASFQGASLPDHSLPLEGGHADAPCAGCHVEGQPAPEYICSDCHDRPEGHLPGECSVCHTTKGWAKSVSFVVDLTPAMSHGVDGQESCLMCHDLDSEIRPAPSNHGDYDEAQCVLCHKAE